MDAATPKGEHMVRCPGCKTAMAVTSVHRLGSGRFEEISYTCETCAMQTTRLVVPSDRP